MLEIPQKLTTVNIKPEPTISPVFGSKMAPYISENLILRTLHSNGRQKGKVSTTRMTLVCPALQKQIETLCKEMMTVAKIGWSLSKMDMENCGPCTDTSFSHSHSRHL